MLHPAIYEQRKGKIPPHIWHDGTKCYSIPALARMRRVTPWAARKWARRRAHVVHNGHIYCALDAPMRGGD